MSFLTRIRRQPDPVESAGTPATDDQARPAPGKASLRRRHPAVARVLTGLAVLLLLVALVAPNQTAEMTAGAFLRIPVEAIVAVALLLLLPARSKPVAAGVLGALLGLLTILKLFDIGYYAALGRPFNPVADWSLLDSAASLLADSVGAFGATLAVIGAIVLAVALPVLMALAALRLTRLVARRTGTAIRWVAALTVVWVTCAMLGAQLVPGVPVASDSAAALAYGKAQQIGETIEDQRAFALEVDRDAFRDVPADQLLTSLRGKDVVIAFIESYGRSAVQNPEFAEHVGPLLDAGSQQLAAAGLGTRSAYLTSATAGGYSWLAHSTLLSGLWINTQPRYDNLVETERFTLNAAFHKAGWRTVGLMPAITEDWPEGRIYSYDKLYDQRNLEYQGPGFSYAAVPDQYALSFLQHRERETSDVPVMAELSLVSSHSPWAPLPRMVDWNAVGDGSIYDPMPAEGKSPDDVWRDPAQVRTEYRRSIEYSLSSLISYAQTYGDDDLVLVFLGDHQPAPYVAGEGTGHDVPITIVARDPAVLDQVSGWGWQEGLRPGADAPVWRMDTFRDRFLQTFADEGTDGSSPH